MFTDPQTLTINAVTNSLPRVESNGTKSIYTKDDGNVSLTISHQKVKNRLRSTVRVDYRELTADPITTGHNLQYTDAAYLVVDRGDGEFTIAKVKQIVDALTAWLTINSGANVTKFLGRES